MITRLKQRRMVILTGSILCLYLLLIRSYSPEQAIRKTIFLNLQFNTAFKAEINKSSDENKYFVNGFIDRATGNTNDILYVKYNFLLGYYVSSVASGP